MTRAGLVLVAALGCAHSSAEILPDSVRIERLDSGLTVFLAQDPNAPELSVQLWFKVGGAYEPADQAGITEIICRCLATGGVSESDVLRDACFFASRVSESDLASALKLERERLAHAELTSADIQAQLQPAANDPARAMPPLQHALLSMLLPGHPYARDPAFISPAAAKLTAAEVNAFRATWFVPGNATLFIIGRLQPASTLELVRTTFAGLKWAEPPAPPPLPALRDLGVAPAPPAAADSQPGAAKPAMDSADRPAISLAWRAPPLGLLETSALDVLLHRLCNPIDGRLARLARENGGEAPTFERLAWRQAGVVILRIPIAEQRPGVDWPRLAQSALEELSTAVPTPVELNRARTSAGRDHAEQLIGFHTRALLAARYEIVAGDWMILPIEQERYHSVTAADLQLAADRLRESKWVQMPAPSAARPAARPRSTAPSAAEALRRLSEQSAARQAAKTTAAEFDLRQLPDEPLALIRLTTTAQRPHVRGVVRHATYRGWSPEQLADFLHYRGITMDSDSDRLDMLGPAHELPVMAEILAELLHTGRARMPEPHVKQFIIVAPAPPQETAAQVAPLLEPS